MSPADFHRWAECFSEALLLLAVDGRVVAGNRAAQRLLGAERLEQIEGRALTELTLNGDAVEESLRRWSGSGQMVYGTITLRGREGSVVRCEGSVVRGGGGPGGSQILVRLKLRDEAVQRFLLLNQTIDELTAEIRARKKTEAEIRQQREWFEVTLASIGDAVIATDETGNVQYMNAVAEALTGWPLADAAGRPMTEVFVILNEKTREPVESPVERVFREGIVVGLANHTVLRARDGTERPIEDSAAPIRSPRGDIIGVVLVFHDVSQLQQANIAMARARDEAVAAARAKDDFLAALSHELRTPLNPVVLIASEGAENPGYPEEARRDFGTIAKNALLEARLIDDLLDLTRITRGKMRFEWQSVDVEAALRDAVATVQAELDAKQIEVEFVSRVKKAGVRADAGRLQQVFWNVLANAAKFSRPGGKVRLEIRADEEAKRFVVTCQDSGIGMTEGELARAFVPFSQGEHADGGRMHRFGGLGLGLAISRMILELHGGRISAQSAGRQQGATFTIELPFANDTPSPEGPLQPLARVATVAPARGAGRLLLVEDHEVTRVSMTQLLVRRGFDVVPVSTVAAALEAARLHRFDVLVSDVGLPDGTGYDLIQKLGPEVARYAVAVTGYGMEQDLEQSKLAGFHAHLTKPVTIQALDAVLGALHGRRRDPQSA